MAISSAATNLLGALLPEWHLLLQGWSADGRLTAAAQEALLLDGEPQALTDLTTQWSTGNFRGLPPIVLLSAADINGAMGAYAVSTGTIYLNADWLAGASKGDVYAVLTEELGHHLDAKLNQKDTLGDEGEAFSNILFNRSINQQEGRLTDLALPNQQENTGSATINGQQVAVEFASTARSISTGSSVIKSLGVNGQGLQSFYGNPYYYSYQIIVGTAATGEYLATPFDISLAEKYTTPAGFDVWTVWKDAGKTKYISLIALNIEEISFSGTYVSNNGGPSGAIPRFLQTYPVWGFRGGGSNEIFLGESSFYSQSRESIFVVAGGDGTDNLFIPLVNANNLKLERNILGLSRISYIDINGEISEYITTGIEYLDYIDKRYALTNPSNYNLVNGTAQAYTSDGAFSVYEASSNQFDGTRTNVSTIGTTGNDLILAGTNGDESFYLSFNGQGGSDVLLFGNFTRASLGNATQLSPSQWRLTFGGLVITANNIEYLQLQDMAVRLNADGTTTDVAWQDDVVPNDNTPNITLAVSPASVLENGVSNLIYTFTRTGPTTNALTVNYGITGTADNSDYTGATPGTGKTITFAANSATATLTIDPTADSTVESNETVALTLASGTGYTVGTAGAVTGMISNDDFALSAITLAVSPASVLEDGTTNLVYTFTRTGVAANALTVNYTVGGIATLGTDYTGIASTPSTKTVTFAAGASTARVMVDPTADTTVESNETVALTVAAGTGYTIGTTGAVTGTIANDDVASSVTATLAANQSTLTLTGTGNINGTGNTLNNIITGNSGNNTLSGLTGADSMLGGLGNDIYIVDNVVDVVTEALNAGTDTIQSSVTYTLGANVENLTLAGSAAINGTGNGLNNVLTGNTAANVLIGAAAADTLTGLTGADTFRFALADSRLAAFDRITDFAIGTDILDGPTAVSTANTKELGIVATLNQASISAVLTTSVFGANQAATFKLGTRTFVALNDATAGFSSTADGLIEITGFTGLLTNLAIV